MYVGSYVCSVYMIQWKLAIKNTLTGDFCNSEQFHVAQYMVYCDASAGYTV